MAIEMGNFLENEARLTARKMLANELLEAKIEKFPAFLVSINRDHLKPSQLISEISEGETLFFLFQTFEDPPTL